MSALKIELNAEPAFLRSAGRFEILQGIELENPAGRRLPLTHQESP